MRRQQTHTITIPVEPSPVPPVLLSIEGAAEAMNLGRTFVCQLIREGRLPSIKIGRRRLVPVSEIQALAARLVEAGR